MDLDDGLDDLEGRQMAARGETVTIQSIDKNLGRARVESETGRLDVVDLDDLDERDLL